LLGFIKRKYIDFFAKISYNYANFGKYPKKPLRKEEKAMLFSPKEKGQGMVEYALIIVLIAIVVIVILTLLGTQISTVFSRISSALGSTAG
jgi:pilus assembly protein Flp/PilA